MASAINYAHPALVSLRRAGQTLGVLRPMVRMYRRIFNPSYENSFDRRMMELVARDDVVWDVGANVGYFTTKFAEKVGAQGRVVAFEPAVGTFSALLRNCAAQPNVSCLNMALADASGSLGFRDSGQENDPTNSLVDADAPDVVKVAVARGDVLIRNRSVPAPTVLKIDVEGYELEVITGLGSCLREPTIRLLFVEVHFLEMSRRGLKDGAVTIARLLGDAGFTVEWTDPSHFIALRR